MTPGHPCEVGAIIQRPFGTAGKIGRTVAGLRFIQLVNRYARRLVWLRFEGAGAVAIRTPSQPFAPFVEREQSLLTPTCFRFLNSTREIDRPQGWDEPTWPRLWTYNLHYFDDLNAQESGRRLNWHRALVARWLRENPPPRGTAWEPYPASLRTVNLAKWLLRTGVRDESALSALDRSARSVHRQLEYHLLGNHLWANAKALYIAGICLVGPDAERWLAKGEKILQAEVGEQILADGAHFELSPMYQGTIVEDALDLLNFARAYGRRAPAGLDRLLPRMLSWLGSMTHPDGGIAHFNDAAPGVAARTSRLGDYAAALGIDPAPRSHLAAAHGCAIEDLASSGYARLEWRPSTDPAAVALCDAGTVGPAYLPGHSHADTLSFELSLRGERVVVNGGISTYAEGDRRLFERSTRAHSTAELAQADSSEVWASFRCGARARIVRRRAWADTDGAHLIAAHDGYAFIPGRWVHERAWHMNAGLLRIHDLVYPLARSGARRIPIAIRFLLHPEVRIRASGNGGRWELLRGGRPIAQFRGQEPAEWKVEAASYALGFGLTSPSSALVGRLDTAGPVEIQSELRFGVG